MWGLAGEGEAGDRHRRSSVREQMDQLQRDLGMVIEPRPNLEEQQNQEEAGASDSATPQMETGRAEEETTQQAPEELPGTGTEPDQQYEGEEGSRSRGPAN